MRLIKFLGVGILMLLFCGINTSSAQSSRSVEDVLKARSSRQTASKKKKKISLFSKKKKSAYTTDEQLRAEYVQRQKDNAKRSRKESKLAKKPQYSNPLYFGHKRPPKKRPNDKKKLCKECGLRH